MKKDNVIQNKSYQFALNVIELCFCIQKEKREFILSRQLLRSATSIGANVEEAIGAQSKKDFYAKMTIAYKEARESRYWIRLIIDSELIKKNTGSIYLNDIEEIQRIIGSIQCTMKKNLQ